MDMLLPSRSGPHEVDPDLALFVRYCTVSFATKTSGKPLGDLLARCAKTRNLSASASSSVSKVLITPFFSPQQKTGGSTPRVYARLWPPSLTMTPTKYLPFVETMIRRHCLQPTWISLPSGMTTQVDTVPGINAPCRCFTLFLLLDSQGV